MFQLAINLKLFHLHHLLPCGGIKTSVKVHRVHRDPIFLLLAHLLSDVFLAAFVWGIGRIVAPPTCDAVADMDPGLVSLGELSEPPSIDDAGFVRAAWYSDSWGRWRGGGGQ